MSENYDSRAIALAALAAEDARNDKLHDLLETIREQILTEIAPERRPNGLMTNIQNAVYAMRGRTRLLDDVSITSPLTPPSLDDATVARFAGCWRCTPRIRTGRWR